MSGYIKHRNWITAALFGLLAATSSVQGASFDCAKAQTKVEHMICDNPELSKLDDELGVAFTAVQAKETQPGVSRQSQQYWLKIRATITDADLLKSYYQRRIALLKTGAPLLKEADKYRFEVSARAGEEGTQDKVPVCRDMLASLKKLNKPPMVCGQEFHPSFKQFTYPEWKKLDPREYRDLILQIVDDVYERDEHDDKSKSQEIQESNRKHRLVSKQWRIKQIDRGDSSLSIATILLSKGQTQVLSFAIDKCDGVTPDAGFPRRYFIVDMEKRRIDFEAMEGEPLFHGEGHLADSRHSELFFFNGIPHLAFWYQPLTYPDNELFIYSGITPYTDCLIEYNEDGR